MLNFLLNGKTSKSILRVTIGLGLAAYLIHFTIKSTGGDVVGEILLARKSLLVFAFLLYGVILWENGDAIERLTIGSAPVTKYPRVTGGGSFSQDIIPTGQKILALPCGFRSLRVRLLMGGYLPLSIPQLTERQRATEGKVTRWNPDEKISSS